VLPARVADFHPRLLDELGAMGEVVWLGRGALGAGDGRVALHRRERVAQLAEPPSVPEAATPLARALLEELEAHGASFFAPLVATLAVPAETLVEALWELAWAGLVTNDTFAPLRALAGPRRHPKARARVGWPEAAGRWSSLRPLFARP